MTHPLPSRRLRFLLAALVVGTALAAAWQKLLDAIHDPAVTRPLALRFKAAEAEGIYDAVPHPDPDAESSDAGPAQVRRLEPPGRGSMLDLDDLPGGGSR